jgi:hypothetical protein
MADRLSENLTTPRPQAALDAPQRTLVGLTDTRPKWGISPS